MRKGTIDVGAGFGYGDILVVDGELLFDINRKKLGLKKSFTISQFNSKTIRFIASMQDRGDIDDVYIGIVDDYTYRQQIIESTLLLPYPVKNLYTEDNYGHWLEIIKPKLHLAIRERQYYNRNSVWLTENLIDVGESLIKE